MIAILSRQGVTKTNMNIKKKNFFLIILSFFLFFSDSFQSAASETSIDISVRIKDIVNDNTTLQCYSGFLCNAQHLRKLYESNNYQPLWIKNGKVSDNAVNFLKFIDKISDEGLNPQHYNHNLITELIKTAEKNNSIDEFAFLDMSLSSSFLSLSSHLISGRINPRVIYGSWTLKSSETDAGPLLLDTITSGGNVTEVLRGMIHKDPHYLSLKSYLKKYCEIAKNNGWEKFGESPRLEKGMNHKKVETLRQILYTTGDFTSANLLSPVFDNDLEKALIKFQTRHGLSPDGQVGQQTATALNMPVEARIKQIELNMESWRWLPRELGEKYLIINIANFELELFEKGNKIMQMKTVVGKPYRMTPVFSSEINQIVLNPHWHVPRSIAVNDILPDIKNNLNTISKKRLKVYARNKNGVSEINPNEADWSQINKRNFNYYFVQPPGDFNALGRIKFNLPNEFDVYLHGTSQKNLFLKNKRDFSSGCVRLEDPLALALYLLKDDARWSKEKIEKIIQQGNTASINIAHSLPAHFLYWTAWVDEKDNIHFREDIYNREELMEKILQDYIKRDKKNMALNLGIKREVNAIK